MVNDMLSKALFIRRFEERLLSLFTRGLLNGTVHTCIGQEMSGLSVAAHAQSDDIVFSNHRGHGHYLAFHDNAEGLMAEIMGRATGICGGVGGSQHLYDVNFFSNGILGGMSPVAVGMAWSRILQKGKGISIVFHGDGALGEGVIYESINMAARWSIPVLWVIERNGYAQSTNCEQTLAGSLLDRASAFGVKHFEGDTWDQTKLSSAAGRAIAHVRKLSAPAILEIKTYRLAAHSKGDDNREPLEVSKFIQQDTINRWAEADPETFKLCDSQILAEIDQIVTRCELAPECNFSPLWSPRISKEDLEWQSQPNSADGERYSDLIYQGFVRLFSEETRLVMIGEDIEGAYGGAFKVTRDLSMIFPGRVRNTPISEAAIVGAGSGAAMGGLLPIVEIMFGDFLTLTFDQLLQHACKFETMYGGKVRVPLIVRSPMGGRRGYGPTHSQSIESHFMGIPELDILALNARVSPEQVYRALVRNSMRPALVIENKILYTRPLRRQWPLGFSVSATVGDFPVIRISPMGIPPKVTIVCYGGMLDLAEEAIMHSFREDEVMAEIICPLKLTPLDLAPIKESVRRTGRVVIIEEGKTFAAFGSEVLAGLVEAKIPCNARRIGYDHFIPSSYTAELDLLPSARKICSAIFEVAHE